MRLYGAGAFSGTVLASLGAALASLAVLTSSGKQYFSIFEAKHPPQALLWNLWVSVLESFDTTLASFRYRFSIFRHSFGILYDTEFFISSQIAAALGAAIALVGTALALE